ncbi:transcription factor grauzone-like [Anopheles aquasalis]|uniref:transcription factor grauzone-like n=1 Tax=Anopheles aquasalis TaxID=42839 RepID=UPI00215A2433|nr:transcription factor grauzone-like [Anopheles aquasalis]
MKQDTQITTPCALCLQLSDSRSINNETPWEEIERIVCKHFWLTPELVRTQFVCENCWNPLSEFHKFYLEIERIHHEAHEPTIKRLVPQNSAEEQITTDCAPGQKTFERIRDESDETDAEQRSKEYASEVEFLSIPRIDSSDDGVSSEVVWEADDETITEGELAVDENGLINDHCRLACGVCKQVLPGFIELRSHFRTEHHQAGYVDCCGRRFRQRLRLLDHVKFTIDPKVFTCSLCGKSFSSSNALCEHSLKHAPADTKIYKCHTCLKSFGRRYQLNIHTRRCKQFRCEDCDLVFHNCHELKLHRKQRHEQKPESFVCKECSKSYSTNLALKRHTENVHGPDRCICDVCSKTFKSTAQFRHHQRIHHAPQSSFGVECSICKKWLKNGANLSKHMSRHGTSNRPNICEVCGKRAPNATALKAHKRFVHEQEKSFQCAICGKAFKRAVTLREHMAVHTGEALYNCPWCTKTFNSNANMHSHKKKMHPTEWESSRKQYEERFIKSTVKD